MGGYFDDILLAVEEITASGGLAFFCFTAIIAVLTLNLCGLILVKRVSAVFKVFWGSMSTLVIWVNFQINF